MRDVKLSQVNDEDNDTELFLKHGYSNTGKRKKTEGYIHGDWHKSVYFRLGGKLFAAALLAFVIYHLFTAGSSKSYSVLSVGSTRWPDSACPNATPFGSCDSNTQSDGNIWATSVCQQNGFNRGLWTGTSKPGCSGLVAMFCEKDPSLPDEGHCRATFRYGCLPKEQTRVEVKCLGSGGGIQSMDTAPELSTIGLDKQLNEMRGTPNRETSKT